MMRKIKFRAWDGEQMVSPDYVDRCGIACWKENLIPQRSDKLMQFIGRHDKNDREIYEGDIVKNLNGCVAVVEWDEEDAGYFIRYINDIQSLIFDELEVIGNIYETPELFKRNSKGGE